jgi:electron transport complex protein RnfG
MSGNVEVIISAGRKEPSSVRLAGTLVVAGMLSGLALAGVYQITAPRIEANKARALREGVFKVVPGSSAIQRLVLRDGQLVVVTENAGQGEPAVHAAYDEKGRFLGWAISGEGSGFQDTIGVLYGYDPTRRVVTGMHILESRETPGLGDKIYKDADFVANFDGLAIEPSIEVVKGGRDAENEVDAITGATISSKAVVKIINNANERWIGLLPDQPPPKPAPAPEASKD